MFELKGYDICKVNRHDSLNSSVPAGIEWLLRFYGIDVGDSRNFQAKYTIIKDGINLNSFDSISKVVNRDFPNVKFKVKEFQTGKEKIDFIEQLIENQTPVLISIITVVTSKDNVYHSVPVVKVDKSHIWIKNWLNESDEIIYKKSELINRHNKYPGGNDILYIEEITVPN
jgi:hypothetical protein